MENKGAFTKILAIMGTILVWLPILAPILFSTIFLVQERVFRFDYLMPAELSALVLVGGGCLLWAALRSHLHRKLIGWSLGIALALLLGIFVIPEITGLADGSTAPGGWQWVLVLGILAVYIVAVVVIGVGGIQLLRDLFKTRNLPLTG